MKKHIKLQEKTIFVTGSAGFIGAHLVSQLMKISDITIIGIDNLNDYYDLSLKKYRLKKLEKLVNSNTDCEYIFIKENIADKKTIAVIFETYHPDIVVNLLLRME